MKKLFTALRFYEGGGLANWKIIKSTEEDLDEHLAEFEQECIAENLGERIGVLTEEEFDDINNLFERVYNE